MNVRGLFRLGNSPGIHFFKPLTESVCFFYLNSEFGVSPISPIGRRQLSAEVADENEVIREF